MAFWPAVIGLVVLMSMPEGGGWSRAGFFFALLWLSIAAADRLAFQRHRVCTRCGETFKREPTREIQTEVKPAPEADAPTGEVVMLEATAKQRLTGGKTCSICGEWFPHSELSYGNRDNGSYCRTCNQEERAAYAQGGQEGAREYRKAMRAKWRGSVCGVRD